MSGGTSGSQTCVSCSFLQTQLDSKCYPAQILVLEFHPQDGGPCQCSFGSCLGHEGVCWLVLSIRHKLELPEEMKTGNLN